MDDDTNFEPSWGYVWGIRLLVGSALVGLATIWLVGYFWNGITDRPTFITINTLAIMAFVITVVGAFTSRETARIAKSQELEMRLQRKATQDTVKLTEDIVKEMQGQREFAARQIAYNEAQIGLMRDQVVQGIGQGGMMQNQLDVMKQSQESFMVSERAYLTIKRLRLVNKPFEANKTPIITFEVFNGGKTPGFGITCRNGTMITPEPLANVQQQMLSGLGKPMNAAYLVGSDRILAAINNPARFVDDASIFAWHAGAVRYYWVAQLRYTYIGDSHETTPFWFEFLPHPEFFGVWTLRSVGEFVTYKGQQVTYKGEPITYTASSENEPPDTYSYEGQDDNE